MSDKDREIAAELIKVSTVTVYEGAHKGEQGEHGDKRLDLAALKNNILKYAKEWTSAEMGQPYQPGDDAHKELAARLNIAAREVLGIIPKEKWDKNFFDYRPNEGDNFMGKIHAFIALFQDPPKIYTDLTCYRTDGGSLATIVPQQSLLLQGVVCTHPVAHPSAPNVPKAPGASTPSVRHS